MKLIEIKIESLREISHGNLIFHFKDTVNCLEPIPSIFWINGSIRKIKL